MATGRLIPGVGFVVETQTNTGKLIPGAGFVIETAAPPGGLNIVIAAYHYNHHLGSMAS